MTGEAIRVKTAKNSNAKRYFSGGLILSFLSALFFTGFFANAGSAEEVAFSQASADAKKSNDNNSVDNEVVFVAKPLLQALITFRQNLNPYTLDAAASREVSLAEVLDIALHRSLDIRLADIYEKKGKVSYLGSLAKTLPDINTGYQYYYLKGAIALPGGFGNGVMNLNSPFQMLSAGFRYYGYRGGSVLFGALQNRNLYRAAGHAKHATISDTLLDASKRYYKLALAEAVLQIRIKMLDISKEQAALSHHLKAAGTATSLEVFQSDTQLTQDRQDLIDQQIERRKAALMLAELLNLDQDTDFSPAESTVRMTHMIDKGVSVEKLIGMAVSNRPELKELHERRRAAQKNVVVAAAPLHPTLSFGGTAYGIGSSANNLSNLNSLNLSVNWNLTALGTQSLADIKTAELGVRETSIRLNKEYNSVVRQVRESYLEMLRTQQQVEEATNQVRSSTEELRVARLRFKNGLVKNIDVLRAQGDATKSLIEKARSIVDFNVAQLQLLHDIGIINVDSLLATKPVVQS